MANDKKDNETFLKFIGNVKPLKETNKIKKDLKLTNVTKQKTNKNISHPLKTTIITKNKETKVNRTKPTPSFNRRLKKGSILINKRVDFHGLSLEKARTKFIKTIDECFYSEKRCILFITGKGIKKIQSDTNKIKLFHGKIREDFKKWIYEKEIHSKILNVVPASSAYGGDGAFFVYLRKNKN